MYSIYQLAIEIGVGIAVFVLCFVDKKGTEANIKEKLGNGFSRGPVAAIIVSLKDQRCLLQLYGLFSVIISHI